VTAVKLHAVDTLDRFVRHRSEFMWQHCRIFLFICCLFNDDINHWGSCPEGRRRVSGNSQQNAKNGRL